MQILNSLLSFPHARLQESRQVNILVGELQFTPDLFTVAVDGSLGYATPLGDLFSAHSIPDHIADGNFGRCHRMVRKRQFTNKRLGNFL